MTAQQEQNLVDAQKRFVDAERLAAELQQESAQAEANVEIAKTAATVTATAQAQAIIKEANDAFFKAQNDQQIIIQKAQQAQVDLSQARLDLNQAIIDSLKTTATEAIPPNQVAGKQV